MKKRAKILAVGCDDLVRKPFKEAEIFDKMAARLGIKYLYDAVDTENTVRVSISLSDLQQMSSEWIAALHQAAIAVDSERIMELIDEIPSNYLLLAKELNTLVREYCFDEIIALTEKL